MIVQRSYNHSFHTKLTPNRSNPGNGGVALLSSVYSIYLIYCAINPHQPRIRLSQAKAEPSLTALTWPVDSESLSGRKPGQSRSFQAKPGQHITRLCYCSLFEKVEPQQHVISC
jgi:hypothetical protein